MAAAGRVGDDIVTHRVFLECTSTHSSRYNTGIQRAVRNLVCASMVIEGPLACVPVIYNGRYLEPIAGLGGSIADSAATATSANRVDRLRRGFHRVRRAITRAIPSVRLRAMLHSQRIEYGLRRIVYATLNARRWMRSFKADARPRVDFRPGDTLVLLDSTWNMDLSGELGRARAAGAAIWVVVNDLIPIEYPDLAPEGTPILLDKWLRRTVPYASGLLGISRTVAEGLGVYLSRTGLTGAPPDAATRIDYFYLGAGLGHIAVEAHALDEVTKVFLRGSGAAYLVVGTIEPRKNHARILDGFDRLWSEGAEVNLVIFGRLGWRSHDLALRIRRHAQFGRRLAWFESGTDAELDYAYRHASALIFASECEGFGLPLVEAMQYGLPVLASDIAVFREIGGDYPRYFDQHDPSSLPDAIRHCELIGGAGSARVPRHWLSWADSARMMLEKIGADVTAAGVKS
ncbi:MAG: glycosyltransferase family 4 protein [Pseudomonadota bacterium]|nr:glycosyltransferase family 4 protein [Pseudomonadota bacterium]